MAAPSYISLKVMWKNCGTYVELSVSPVRLSCVCAMCQCPSLDARTMYMVVYSEACFDTNDDAPSYHLLIALVVDGSGIRCVLSYQVESKIFS